MRNIPPLSVVQPLDKLFLIIFKIIVMYMLDARNAFDKVSFTKLFALFIKRDIPAVIHRVVLELYPRKSVAASCNGCI